MGVIVVVILAEAAVAAFPLLEFRNAFQQLQASEVGPQCLRHVDLGVGELPEQEVAEPHLAAGANHQVRIGQMACLEVPRNGFFIHVQVTQPAIASGSLG